MISQTQLAPSETVVEGERGERIVLTIRPAQLPRLAITDSREVTTYKTVGLADLLKLLDSSTIVETLKAESLRTVDVPQLPENCVRVRLSEMPTERHVHVAGWLDPFTQPFVLNGRSYVIDVPALAYRLTWNESEETTIGFEVGVFRPGESGSADGSLYRWPFSNVFNGRGKANKQRMGRLCWSGLGEISTPLVEAPRRVVSEFVASANNRDLFGSGQSHAGPKGELGEFLELVEREGLDPDWLIPLEETLATVYPAAAQKNRRERTLA